MIGSKGTLANYLHCVLPKICLPYTCRPIRVEISASSTPECAIKSKSAEYDGARIILYLPQESNDNQKVFCPCGLLAHYRCVLIKTESATDIPFYDFALFKDEN